jgi:hypothetical protein
MVRGPFYAKAGKIISLINSMHMKRTKRNMS